MLWFSNPRKRSGAVDEVPKEADASGSCSPILNSDELSHDAFSGLAVNDSLPQYMTSDMPNAAAGEKGKPAPASREIPELGEVPPLPHNLNREFARNRPAGRRHSGGVALALGGGVAKGWAHIGALRAADEFGLPVSMIAGTSIGALVGGCYLAGKLDELEAFARSFTKANMVRYMDFTLRGSGLIAGGRLARRMEEHMSDVRIEDLPKPFVAVATEISSGHEVWLGDGPIVPALRASYALPGVFTPVRHGGRLLVDGALVNPVPVSVCRAYEPDVVIAINLNSETFGRATVIRPALHDPIEEAITHDENSQAASWFSFMHQREKITETKNRLGVTSVMVEAFNIIQDRIARARLAGDPPDFTIRPKLRSVGLIEFHKADQAIDLGYREMITRLTELQDQGAFERLEGFDTESA